MASPVVPPYPNYPLVLQQNNSWSARFIFGQGKVGLVIATTAGAAPTVQTEDPHCLGVNDVVHLAVEDECCQLRYGCYQVTQVVDPSTVNLNLIEGQAAAGKSDTLGFGWISRAIDLTGFNVKGAIATRQPNSISPPNLYGSIAQGDNSILVSGDVNVSQGDTLNFTAANIVDATVQGVFKSYASTTATTADNTVIVVNKEASATVSASSPQKFTISGGVIADFTFVHASDPRCGYVTGYIDQDSLGSVILPSTACCDDLHQIGCYQIILCCGAPAPRASYPRSSYVGWASTFSAGPVYLRSGFVNV